MISKSITIRLIEMLIQAYYVYNVYNLNISGNVKF